MQSLLRHPLVRIAAASIPVAVVYTLSWFGIFTFVNGYLKHELGYTSEDWTAVTLWFTGSMVVWPFFCSEFSAWLGRRLTVALAMLLGGVLFLGFNLFSQRLAIGAMLALMALTVAVISAVWMPMVAAAGGSRPGRALITFNFTNTIIGATALIAGGYATAFLGYRQAFLCCAAGCFLGAFLFLLVTRTFEDGELKAKVVSLRRLSRADVLALLTGPYLVIVLCGLSMEAFNYHTVNQLWPNLAREVHGMGEKTITFMVALARLPALLTLTVLAQFIDRVNPMRFYGFSFLYVAACVFTLGLVPNDGALRMAYVAYFIGMGCVWGSNSPSVNAAVPPRLRDSAFALMLVPAQLAVFLVGVFHNRLLAAGLALPEVFRWCGLIAALGGGLVLIVYSFAHRPRRAAVPAEETLAADPVA